MDFCEWHVFKYCRHYLSRKEPKSAKSQKSLSAKVSLLKISFFNNFFTNIDTNLVKDIPGAEKNFYEFFIDYNVLSNRWVV